MTVSMRQRRSVNWLHGRLPGDARDVGTVCSSQRACNMASVQWRDGQPTCRWHTETTHGVLQRFCCQQIRRRGVFCVLVGVVRAKTGVRGSRHFVEVSSWEWRSTQNPVNTYGRVASLVTVVLAPSLTLHCRTSMDIGEQQGE